MATKYITLKQYSLEEISQLIKQNAAPKLFTINGITYRVKVGTDRLMVLNRTPYCVQCGLKGNAWLLQQQAQHADRMVAQLNLWYVDPINPSTNCLMTIDHVIPRSKGGSDHISNLQTMCVEDNLKKAALVDTGLLLSYNLKKFKRRY